MKLTFIIFFLLVVILLYRKKELFVDKILEVKLTNGIALNMGKLKI